MSDEPNDWTEADEKRSCIIGQALLDVMAGEDMRHAHAALCQVLVIHFAGMPRLGMSKEDLYAEVRGFCERLPARIEAEMDQIRIRGDGSEQRRAKGLDG